MLHMDLNVGGRKEEEEEEEGGVTGLILQPLDDDLRSGRGTELDPSPATKKMENKKKNKQKTLSNGNPNGSVQPNATTVHLP